MRAICFGDFGRDAVRAGLRTIVVVNVPTTAETSVSFVEGRLEVRGAYGTGEGMPQDTEI